MLGLTDEDIGYSHSAVKRRVWVRPPSPRKVSQTSLAAVTAGDTRSDLAKDDMVATLAPNSSASAPEGKDECSVYFRSHSGSNSERQSSSRRSSASSSVPSKRKRTLYLGKTQRFPLRRVGSIVVSSDGGVGLNRIPADDTTGEPILRERCGFSSWMHKVGRRNVIGSLGSNCRKGAAATRVVRAPKALLTSSEHTEYNALASRFR